MCVFGGLMIKKIGYQELTSLDIDALFIIFDELIWYKNVSLNSPFLKYKSFNSNAIAHKLIDEIGLTILVNARTNTCSGGLNAMKSNFYHV